MASINRGHKVKLIGVNGEVIGESESLKVSPIPDDKLIALGFARSKRELKKLREQWEEQTYGKPRTRS